MFNSGTTQRKEARKKREELAQQWDHLDVVIDVSDIKRSTKLASGNYGTVYEGTCRGQPVAIKVLHNQDLDKEKLEALKKEVDIMKRLRHPKIMMLMGMCVDEGNIALVMEYVPGRDLADVISNERVPLSLEDKLKITKDIAIGCNWLHCLVPPIIHRDLKPANIMITRDGEIRVCDFGLSCIKEVYDPKAPRKTTAVGTPVWMAPEILCGYPNSEKSDVYAYALVIWELFVRKEKPFAELDDFPTFCRLLVEEHIRPKFSANVPGPVREFIEKCWIQDPKKRPFFSEILEKIDDVIIETLINDDSGRNLWKLIRKERKSSKSPFNANWRDFLAKLCEVLPGFDVKGHAAQCLELMLAEVQKDITQSKSDQVKLVKTSRFGDFLALFGPVAKIPEFATVCKEGAFHGHIDSAESEKRLKHAPKGAYLTRVSGRENSLVISIALGQGDPQKVAVHVRVGRGPAGYSVRSGGLVKEKQDLVSLLRELEKELDLAQKWTEGSPYAKVFSEGSGLDVSTTKYVGEKGESSEDLLTVLKMPVMEGDGPMSSSSHKERGSGHKKKSKRDKKKDGSDRKSSKKKEKKATYVG